MADGRFQISAGFVNLRLADIHKPGVVEEIQVIHKSVHTPAKKGQKDSQNTDEPSQGMIGNKITVVGCFHDGCVEK